MSREERLSAVGAMEGLSLVRQCELAGVSRSSLYYRPAGESEENLALMREIDETHLKYPFYGVRQMRSHLRLGGARVGVKRVRRLMRLMGLSALQPRPRTSSPAPGHRVYPYLLGGVEVVEADQAWCADITYIPVKSGFFYLVAVMDWATRCVLSWRLSNTMDAGFCVEALEDALRGGTPGIFNTDQGAQLTSLAFTERVLSSGAKVSMDGRGRYMDNIFIERLWWSLKYEAVYLHELEDGRHARRVVGASSARRGRQRNSSPARKPSPTVPWQPTAPRRGVADVQGTKAQRRGFGSRKKRRFAPIEGRMPSLRRISRLPSAHAEFKRIPPTQQVQPSSESPRSEGILPSI